MKTLKIIIGIFILIATGAEYVNASKQLLTYFSPDILAFSVGSIFLSAYLIGNGFSQTKLEIKSIKFALYFTLSLVAFVTVAFINLITYKFDPEIIKINGINVDIAQFMNGSQKIIPNEKERRQYCTCIVSKLTAVEDIVDNYSQELKNGKIDKILIELKSTKYINDLNLNECMSSIQNFNWTSEVEKGMRENIMSQIDQEYSKTNNPEKYCNCLIDEYKKLPLREVASNDFYKTQKNYCIDSICNLKSKIK